MGKLDGKVAIVTGSSRGIGKSVALLFAAEGAKVVCASRTLNEGDLVARDPSLERGLSGSLNTTVAEIKQAGGTAIAVKTDVSNEDSCTRLLEATHQAFGPVDVLVNNAVMGYMIAVRDFSRKQWEECFEVNVQGPYMLTMQVLPDMIKRRNGAIVNLTSVAAVGPGRGPYTPLGKDYRFRTTYGATKAALERFTQGLAEEIYQYGISVAAVGPSTYVPTPTTYYLFHDESGGEPGKTMAQAVMLLAIEPLDKVTGRVTYSQAILKEFGWIDNGEGYGINKTGSGYSQQ
ncbi:SDR family NAD(P)-dependent oxidoreductase [Chloroflexota bacterium]